jgi:hypothetical protein
MKTLMSAVRPRFIFALLSVAFWLMCPYPVFGAEGPRETGGSPRGFTAAPQGLPYGDVLVIPAAAFHADGFLPDSQFFPFGGGYFVGDSGAYGCMVAEAYLANTATITEIYASVYDNDPARTIAITLGRADNFAGGTDTLASLSTTSDFSGVQVISDLTISNPVVVYPDYSYYLTVCLESGDIRLYSVRIYNSFLFSDDFESGGIGAWSSAAP